MKKSLCLSFITILFIALPLFLGCSAGEHREATMDVSEDQGYAPKNYKRSILESADRSSPAEARTEREAEPAPAKRLVIYRGRMQIQVVHPASTLPAVTSIARDHGGLVEQAKHENQGQSVEVVLRIPVARFFDVMDALAGLGTVLTRSIQAKDVTAAFMDVENRLKSARILKARLEKLLRTVKSVEEKVRILREINRLATEIETLSARSKDLMNRASMSTIAVRLQARPQTRTVQGRRSPFPFIRALRPERRSIKETSSMERTAPAGFFDNSEAFEDGDDQQFFSPDGTVLRSGEVDNNPVGDASFWSKALQLEFQRRSYKELKSVPLPNGHLFVYRIHDGLNIYYYGIAFRVTGQKIQVFEAFSPGEEAFKKDGAKMVEFLRIGGPL